MKDVMRETDQIESVSTKFQEMRKKALSERTSRADRLVEEWSKMDSVGEGMVEAYDENPSMARNLAIVLENTANEMSKMSETMVSSAFNGLTPENALRVIRLGYPNSNRGKAFHEFAMETAEDGMWYLSPTYATSKRGATAGDVTHESSNSEYASFTEKELPAETPDGSIVAFTGASGGALSNAPIRPFQVRIVVNNIIVAQDDGSGNLVGSVLDGGATNTVDYVTGAITVTFATAPAIGAIVDFEYVLDYEAPSQYEDLGEVNLELRKVNFKLRSYRLGLTWSKQSELTLGTTLNIDAQEALLKGASEELKKALDYEAFKLGYRTSLKNGTAREFDTDHLSAGSDSPKAHAQSLGRVFADTADDIRDELNRGGISAMFAGSSACNYLTTLSDKFAPTGAQEEIGIYQVGTYDGKPLFKVPGTSVMPKNEVVTVWNNESAGDHAIAFGVLLPMYNTQVLEFKNGQTETSLAEYGDHRVLQQKYVRRVVLKNSDKTY